MNNGKQLSSIGLILGIAGLAASIIGLFASGWLCVFAFPIAIVGLVLSIVGGKKLKEAGEPSSAAGLVVGIIAVAISAILFFTCGLCTVCVSSAESAIEDAIDDAKDIVNNYLP